MEQFYWKATPWDFRVRRSFEKETSFSQKPEIESFKLECILCMVTEIVTFQYGAILYWKGTSWDFRVRRSFEKEASFSQKLEIESSKLECILCMAEIRDRELQIGMHSMHGDWICNIRMKHFFTEKRRHGTFELNTFWTNHFSCGFKIHFRYFMAFKQNESFWAFFCLGF